MQQIGFMTIIITTAILINFVNGFASEPATIESISSFSPWIGEHAQVLGWLASAVIGITGLAIPPVMVSRGSDGLEKVGKFSAAMSVIYVLITMVIPAIAYVLYLILLYIGAIQ